MRRDCQSRVEVGIRAIGSMRSSSVPMDHGIVDAPIAGSHLSELYGRRLPDGASRAG